MLSIGFPSLEEKKTMNTRGFAALLLLIVGTWACEEKAEAPTPVQPEETKVKSEPEPAPDVSEIPVPDAAVEKAPNPHGFVPSAEITTDESLLALFETWKGARLKKSHITQVKAKAGAWRAPLLAALKHEDANVRSNAAGALRQLGKNAEVTKAYIARLGAEPDGDVRAYIAKELVRYKSKETVPALMEVLRADENENARANAAWALREIGDKRAAQALVQALDDPQSWVRLYAVGAVKEMRLKKAIPKLRLLRSDPSGQVAEKAEKALKALGAR